jgi:hypothetical protein
MSERNAYIDLRQYFSGLGDGDLEDRMWKREQERLQNGVSPTEARILAKADPEIIAFMHSDVMRHAMAYLEVQFPSPLAGSILTAVLTEKSKNPSYTDDVVTWVLDYSAGKIQQPQLRDSYSD